MNDSFTPLVGLVGLGAYGAFWFGLSRKGGDQTQRSGWMTITMFIPPANLGSSEAACPAEGSSTRKARVSAQDRAANGSQPVRPEGNPDVIGG